MPIDLLAAISDLAPPSARSLPGRQAGSPVAGDVVIVLALGLAVSVVLVVLVYCWHRRKHQRSGDRTGWGGGVARASNEGRNEAARPGRRRRMRRNPTLAETGGLPPPRTEGDPSPPAV